MAKQRHRNRYQPLLLKENLELWRKLPRVASGEVLIVVHQDNTIMNRRTPASGAHNVREVEYGSTWRQSNSVIERIKLFRTRGVDRPVAG
jgi:hypothetical protein